MLRGEDLLSSTPRQIALYDALAEIGVGTGVTPRFGHLPYVMGEGNKKLSKRDPEAHLLGYRDRGFLPEGLLNYLALLGWAIAEDRDVFTLEEMVAAFDISRVNPNPARFDLKKAEAINASHMRLLSLEEMTVRVTPYLQHAGVLSDPVTDDEASLLDGGHADGRRADQQADRGRRHARLPVRRRGRVHPRPRRRRQAAGRRRARGRAGVVRGLDGADRVDDAGDRGGAAGEADRRDGAQAAPRVRPGARRDHRPADLARRCSSRWSCWAASADWPAWTAR